MIAMEKGRFRVREARTPGELGAVRALRAEIFPADRGGVDDRDAHCRNFMVEDVATRAVVAAFRVMVLGDGRDVEASYSARFYDLGALGRFAAPMLELGRFCIRPGDPDPDILRLAWGALTGIVDLVRAEMLFGCASFPGTDPCPHGAALALLGERHLGPDRWRPGARAARIEPLAPWSVSGRDDRRAMAEMPPLLRTYLTMGGWVGDHAVIDEDMGTLHVFTAVEVDAIPPARRRLLRALASRARD